MVPKTVAAQRQAVQGIDVVEARQKVVAAGRASSCGVCRARAVCSQRRCRNHTQACESVDGPVSQMAPHADCTCAQLVPLHLADAIWHLEAPRPSSVRQLAESTLALSGAIEERSWWPNLWC